MRRGRIAGVGVALLAVALGVAARPPWQTSPATTAGYALALPGYQWRFPRDDSAHPTFANEWWYFTGNLADDAGRRYGFELTFFRISPEPGAPLNRDIYLTHFALTDATGRTYEFHERARRGNWGQAGAAGSGDAIRLWDENWSAEFSGGGPRRLTAAWDGFSMELEFSADPGGRVLNGVGGLSQKSEGAGHASYYYSFPRLAASGELGEDGQKARVSGEVWMDHEFGSNQMSAQQRGWDWMGLQLGGGGGNFDLMLFNLRTDGGGRDPHSAATLASAGSGGRLQAVALGAADFSMQPTDWWRSGATGIRYPVAWHVSVPARGIDLEVRPLLDDQEFRSAALDVSYWEGAVTVSGKAGGHDVGGRGYLELTGYGRRFGLLQGPQ